MSERPHPSLYQVSTTATTRIAGWDAISSSISIAQAVYPATSPNAVLLTRPDYYPEVLSAARLMHRPFDAVLLYTEGERLEEAVSRELIRLSPRGHGLPAQVIVIGSVHAQVLHDLNDLGFSIWHLIGQDVWDTIERIAEIDMGHATGNALLVGANPLAGGVVAGGYAAHTGTPLLFAGENGLFPSAIHYLRRHPRTRVFIAAPGSSMPGGLAGEIRGHGARVEGWIGGADVFDMAMQFAKFRHQKARFGWGRRDRTAAPVAFVPYDRWDYGVAAAVLSHRGKQTPLLLTKRDLLPQSVETGLLGLRARAELGAQTHSFLVGSLDAISYQVQMRIHRVLAFEGDL